MKLLVFAHIPPPHHGQSYMVKQMLDGLGGDARERDPSQMANGKWPIECFHVNAQFSQDMEDIGVFRSGKIFLLLRYCAEAIWCRFRYGVTNFYYIPAPGKRTTMFRDWIVMALCRPFFKRVIFHWHALGLGDWLYDDCPFWHRWVTHWLMDRPDLSIALAIANMRTALWFKSRRVEIVPNGIPDPCPDFDKTVLPLRKARAEARAALLAGTSNQWSVISGQKPETSIQHPASASHQSPVTSHQSQPDPGSASTFRVLYLAHCTRDKGLFDALDAVALANAQLASRNSPIRVHITVAGAFLSAEEEKEFKHRIAQPDLAGHHAGLGTAQDGGTLSSMSSVIPSADAGDSVPPAAGNEHPVTSHQPPVTSHNPSTVTYAGFVSGAEKDALLRDSDCYLFPTYYSAEAQPVSIIEAMAYGLPVISTRWRAIPDVLPPVYPYLMEIRDTARAADLLLSLAGQPGPVEELRAHFLKCYSDREHIRRLCAALASVEQDVE